MVDNQQDEEGKKENMRRTMNKRKEVGVSCMLNTEVSSVLAVMRRSSDSPQFYHLSDDNIDCSLLQRFKTLRRFIFDPPDEWRNIDPSEYLSPFLEAVQGYDVPATATGIALSSILKILKLDIFDEKTPGAADIMNSIVTAITGCRLEKTDSVTEDAVMVRILYILTAVMKHKAHIMLTDRSVCKVVNTCFIVVQQSANRGDLLQRTAGHTMMELIHIIYSRLPKTKMVDDHQILEIEDPKFDSGFGIYSAADIFQFLCSLLNDAPSIGLEIDGYSSHTHSSLALLDVQMFALILINSAIELSGDSMGSHPKLLGLVQDELFHHLIRYGTNCNPLVLSMICSIVLNIYHLLHRSVRLQLEAFFSSVLFVAAKSSNLQIQEVAIEAIVNFYRQPTFTIEMYVNYDCSVYFLNVFEETAKLICKNAFPVGGALTSLQLQSFEGLAMMIHNIAENVDKEDECNFSGPYPIEGTRFWEEISKDDLGLEDWINELRIKKVQKKRLLIARHHFNQDCKKGLDYVKLSGLVSGADPPDPKAYAIFFRYTPGLDKTLIGDFFGEPDEFHIQVLQEFVNTFDFSGMLLDTAMRCFLETFKLPGESQKIGRIIEEFAGRFFDQCTSDLFECRDAVFLLGYSIIMLNTDLHNPQVKKKMSLDDFIKNNRDINSGKDLPKEYLLEIFNAIASRPFMSFGSAGTDRDMNYYRWAHLVNQSKIMNPYAVCEFDRRIGRDMFAAIAGPSIATVAAIFEHSNDENVIYECVEVLFSIARIAQFQLQDTLDELICVFCKFTTLLNPYASADETLFAFSHDLKARLATLAVFNIANNFKDSLRGSWRNIVDCLLKLRKLKLLPPSAFDPDALDLSSWNGESLSGSGRLSYSHSHSNTIIDYSETGKNGLVSRFQDFVSMENVEESLNLGMSQFEQNMQIIQQCHIESIFRGSSGLPKESLWNLGRYLILAAGGKGQKFSTPIEEEETVAFCWDLIATIAYANTHRFSSFWPQYHEYLLIVPNLHLFSPIPFAEKAMVAQVKICLKLLSMSHPDKMAEELIFKSMNLMSKLEKDILDTCSDFLLNSVSKIIKEYPTNVQSSAGWRSILQLLSVTGRHPESYDQGVEALISLLSHKFALSRMNYVMCLDCAFNFIALKNSSVEKNIKIMDLICETVKLLVQWHRNEYVDPDSNASVQSGASISSTGEETSNKGGGGGSSSNNTMSLFAKLGEVLRKICLSRREEVRNYAVLSIQKTITLSDQLCFTPANSIFCFKKIVFPMVDDIYEKMLEYANRGNAEKESISMENSLKIAIGVMTEVYLQLLNPLSENPQFKVAWVGVMRRMENHLKAGIGDRKETLELMTNRLKKIVGSMKEKDMLVPRDVDDLWDMTYLQIQRMIPSLVEELFPNLTGL